jgi:hypothetical protein
VTESDHYKYGMEKTPGEKIAALELQVERLKSALWRYGKHSSEKGVEPTVESVLMMAGA